MSTSGRGPSTLSVAVALGTVYIVWGSTYLAIAYVVDTLPPLISAGARFLAAGGLLVAFVAAQHAWRKSRGTADRLPFPRLVEWRTALIVGALLLLGGNGLVSLAEQRIPSSIAAVMIATVPIWMSLFEALLTRTVPSLLAIGGIAVGLVGAVILLLPAEGVGALDPLGVAMVAGSAMAWACGSLYARRGPLPRNALLGTGMEQIAGGVVLFLVGAAIGEPGRLVVEDVSSASLLGLAYLVVFGSLAAFTAYTWLLNHVPVTTVSTYAYVNPVVAVALGVLFRNEPLTPRTVIAAVLIIGAVVAMVSGRPRDAEDAGPAPELAAMDRDDAAA
ncbi:MAG TPA: EamA family transporter [Candidatus Limnocylindria bacterium]|nr:EamA family transporter [Candidatus Limnocylindria bacterium]